jgi:hypothetical protein
MIFSRSPHNAVTLRRGFLLALTSGLLALALPSYAGIPDNQGTVTDCPNATTSTIEQCLMGGTQPQPNPTPGQPPPNDKIGQCFGSQQCNTYADTTRQYDPENGYYCGGSGSGCTECVNAYCDACTTTDPFCIP